MKLKFMSFALLLALIAFIGCNDVAIDEDSADAGSSKSQVAMVEINADNFDSIVNGQTPVILDFWAPW
ncbi:MAG: hypothetical protein AAFN77_03530 [Planctomycetota bacterium]